MTTDKFKAFEAEAAKHELITPSERIEEGGTGWLSGVPVTARDKHCLSICLTNGAVATVAVTDVVDVVKGKQLFHLRVKTGADAVISTEAHLKLADTISTQDCACEDGGSGDVATRIFRPVFDNPFNSGRGGPLVGGRSDNSRCHMETRRIPCDGLDLPGHPTGGTWSCFELVMVCGDSLLDPDFLRDDNSL